MASSNQTSMYKLCQWLENDPVLREDFNADNRKVEGALVSMQTALNENKPITGEYWGTGLNSGANTINLGFRPKFVLIMSHGDANGGSTNGALAIGSGNERAVVITSNGFQVSGYQNATDAQMNYPNPYRYLVFRG